MKVLLFVWVACGLVSWVYLWLSSKTTSVLADFFRCLLIGPIAVVALVGDLVPSAQDEESEGSTEEEDLVGTVNAGYRIIAVKEAEAKYPIPLVPAISIVLAKKTSRSASTAYVVWEYVGNGEFRSGIYRGDEAKAREVFDSRK